MQTKKIFFIKKFDLFLHQQTRKTSLQAVFERVEKIFEKNAQKVCRLKKFDYLCTTNLQQSGCGL